MSMRKHGWTIYDPKEVRLLVTQVKNFLAQLDVVMTEPTNKERGERIAQLANGLDLSVQVFERFGKKKMPKAVIP